MKNKIFILAIILLLVVGFAPKTAKPAKAEGGVTIYVVPAITDEKILPTSSISEDYISNEISIVASPGEYEPASFVIRAHEDITSLEVEATELTGEGGSIPSSNVDIRVVKCWYQSGEDIRYRGLYILTPELLLKDDSLVKVEGEENYLKLTTGEYVWISGEEGIPGIPDYPTPEEFPVKDSSSLQPVNISQGTNKQFWITVKVPNVSSPGSYTGKIKLGTPAGVIGELDLTLEVLPFELAEPYLIYSLYYKSYLDPTGVGSVGEWLKSEEQFQAELGDLLNHGVTYPPVYHLQRIDDLELFAKDLRIRKEIGLKTTPLFLLGKKSNLGFGTPSEPSELEELKQRVREITEVAEAEGYSDIYFYGVDEAGAEGLIAQRPAWEAIHEAGGKIFVAGHVGAADAAGDLLDLLICAFEPNIEEANKMHGFGHQIFSYANPQVGEEKPETYRRNYGLLLWQEDYDGAMNFAYQWQCDGGNIWNDYDHYKWREHNFVYPTIDGVIDTIQWEGWREGVDDIRYLTTLLNVIEEAKAAGKDTSSAENWLADLNNSVLESKDLDTVRLGMIAHILNLLRETPDTTPPVISLVTASAIPPSTKITWKTDELSTSQVEYGKTEDLGLSTELDTTAFVLNHVASLTTPAASTTYYYRVKSIDVAGNLAISDIYSFTTPPLSSLSISFIPPTDPDNAVVNRDWTEVNVSVDSTYDTSSFIDWNRSLVGYWNFNEGAGSTAGDKSTYGNDGTLMNNPQWTTGKFGPALEFDGDGDYVDCGNDGSLNFNDEITIEAWIKAVDPSVRQSIVARSSVRSWYLNLKFGRLTLTQKDINDGFTDKLGNTTLQSNRWYHVAVVYKDSEKTVYFYLNGEPDGSGTYDYPMKTTGWGSALIGGYGSGTQYSFNGLIDEVRIWNRAFSPEEINASYNTTIHSLSRTFADLVDGTYEYYAYTTDLTGNSAQTETRTLTIDTTGVNHPPVLDPIGNKTVAEGELLEFTISATDPDGDSLTYSASNLPSGASFVGQTFSWTPTSIQAGTYPNVHFEVSDGELSDSEDITIQVIEPVPVAEFSANPTSGNNPLEVQFSDQSTGSITSWSWDFGDGGTSAEQNPSHTYTSAGNYTISLTVTGPGGSNTKTKTDYITVVGLGDANGDGEVNTADITMLERIVVGLEDSTSGADANQDGKVNTADITKIERIIAGLD